MLGCSTICDAFSYFLIGSVEINYKDISTRIYLAQFPGIVKGQAVVLCDYTNPDSYVLPGIYFGCCSHVDMAPYIFAPAKCGITSNIEATSALAEFADLCVRTNIECLYICGHFNQLDADRRTGRGSIKHKSYDIQTMDIFKAIYDPFYRLALGIKKGGR